MIISFFNSPAYLDKKRPMIYTVTMNGAIVLAGMLALWGYCFFVIGCFQKSRKLAYLSVMTMIIGAAVALIPGEGLDSNRISGSVAMVAQVLVFLFAIHKTSLFFLI